MAYRYANADCVVSWEGLRLRLVPGAAWPDDDPFVRARPELFTDTPSVVHTSGGPVVETATRRPGERRTTRRG